MIEDTKGLKREGMTAYKQARYAEAALLYARIRRSGEELRDHISAFEAGVWETESLFKAGRFQQAMNLLLTVLAQPPTKIPEHERWIAQKKVFDILRSTRPEVTRLRQALDDISALAKQQPHPASDLSFLYGDLDQCQGNWGGALQHFEQAWVNHSDGGYIRSGSAYSAGQMTLKLHRVHEAQAWRNHLADTDQAEFAGARRDLRMMNSHLALYTLDRLALSECRDAGCGTNDLEARVHLTLRGESRHSHDDPYDPFHPARALLRKRLENSKDVHLLYDYRLCVVDYHLASLRYAAGLPAIEDYYYQCPVAPPSRLDIANPQDFTKRLLCFDKALCRLERHARWLDGLLQCDYRTMEAQSRRERRDAIAGADA